MRRERKHRRTAAPLSWTESSGTSKAAPPSPPLLPGGCRGVLVSLPPSSPRHPTRTKSRPNYPSQHCLDCAKMQMLSVCYIIFGFIFIVFVSSFWTIFCVVLVFLKGKQLQSLLPGLLIFSHPQGQKRFNNGCILICHN